MGIVNVGGAPVEVMQTGSGRDLVLLHSLLSDRSAFDKVVPLLSKTVPVSKAVVFMVCVLKKEMGRNGIFLMESTVAGSVFIATQYCR